MKPIKIPSLLKRKKFLAATARRASHRQRGRFGLHVALDDFGHLAALAHHALRGIERDPLAIVIEGQHGKIVPALQAAVGQLRRG